VLGVGTGDTNNGERFVGFQGGVFHEDVPVSLLIDAAPMDVFYLPWSLPTG
jgi:hypothetical protein